MVVTKDTRETYFFKNTCHHCFNDIEYPSLGDFSYGELIFQTTDAKDFAIATLIDNITFASVTNILKSINNKKSDPQNILARLADPLNNQEFTKDTLCPICRHKQGYFTDLVRTNSKELSFVTWNKFESLIHQDKLILIMEIINAKI